MDKREKVIKGLEACELNDQCKPYCQEQGCPYVVHYAMQECIEKLHRDALEMLRAKLLRFSVTLGTSTCDTPDSAAKKLKEWDEKRLTLDTVVVVRCKDCKYWDKHFPQGCSSLCTRKACLIATLPDDFCSDGERREDDADET